MAIKNRPPGLRYILLLLLFIFGTQVYSQEFSQDLGGYDGQAVNGSHLDTVHEFAKREDDSPDGGSCCSTPDIASFWKTVQKRGSPSTVQKDVPPHLEAILLAATENGRVRRGKMMCNQYTASPFTADTAPYDNGWVAKASKGYPDRDPNGTPGREKAVDAVVREVFVYGIDDVKVPFAVYPNPYYEWVHDRPNNFITLFDYGNILAPAIYGPTNAIYANHMNPKAGIIVCVNNYGPDWSVRQGAAQFPPHIIGPPPPMK
ncbi:hypothetical protein LTR15_005492 [Elasticomyces elasticus]|nr:hypothetical protein LTR15_005492 [Elasticomyces elasticus]